MNTKTEKATKRPWLWERVNGEQIEILGEHSVCFLNYDVEERKLAEANATLIVESVNERDMMEAIAEAAKPAVKLLRQSMESHNTALKDADAESRFYGEDIVTPPILNALEQALAALSRSRKNGKGKE